ncbi:rhomboid family intramembrane serine protease [Desulfurivibrio sp. C05AmB]|uniref:rhomboid family intramembrane serine protease n=1 Tax=Desulfurivibrio sp. C05AmB TaxID=3374371 RepID=UPI00376EC0F1
MFIPVGDTPNPSKFAWMTWGLMLINIGVFFLISLPLMNATPDPGDPVYALFLESMRERGIAVHQFRDQITAYDLLVFRYGFRPAEATILTLFSSMFLHGGWAHLIGNMLYLWIFGNNVEYRLGALGFLGMYLATGVIATLFFTLFVPGSNVPLIGASGAISGVLGCYFLWFPRNTVKVFVFLFPFYLGFIYVPAPVVLGVYLLIDNLLPFLVLMGASSGVAYGAHIGGFLAGLVIALVLRHKAPRGGRG